MVNNYSKIDKKILQEQYDEYVKKTIGLGKVEDTEPMTILNMLDTLLYSDKPSEENAIFSRMFITSLFLTL